MTGVNAIILGFLAVGQADPSSTNPEKILSTSYVQVPQVLPALKASTTQTAEENDSKAIPAPESSLQTPNFDAEILPALAGPRHFKMLPEVWGFAGMNGYYAGLRMAPNGKYYGPFMDLNLDLNIGILPDKKLYLFADTTFWLQRATAGQTQSNWDFTKREYDIAIGPAWNYWGPMEFRAFGYAYNNLNRGSSKLYPSGYNDGFGLENRYYFPNDDKYDVPRLSFLSVGYLPTKSITGGDGEVFNPGFFARAYLAYDFNFLHSYAYVDGQILCERICNPRLLSLEAGLASRPFEALEGLEFRIGVIDLGDVRVSTNHGLAYLGIRIVF